VEYPGKTTDLLQVTDKLLTHNIVSSTSHHERDRDSNSQLAVIGTDCIDSCRSNYHMIMTTTVPSPISTLKLTEKYVDPFKTIPLYLSVFLANELHLWCNG
jgi:hypothetical protein